MAFITAEIGVNWNGDFDLVEQMISDAKKAGCDAVKFQSFNESNISDHPQKEKLLQSSISEKNIENIHSIAKNNDIEWYCTPMYPEAIDFLNSYVKRFKIRFSDSLCLHENKFSKLIENVLKTKKQIIISSQSSPKKINLQNDSNIKWLYVVPKYPCSFEDLDFSCIADFDGYSNHCRHILAPLTAAILGAEMIEIHMTSNKIGDFFDNPVSFDYEEISKLVNLIRLSEKIKK
jgi:sialic acid synthase SpsE